MKTTTKVALAVAGGYLMGRRKKAKAALVMGSWLVGKKIDPGTLLREAVTKVAESPEVTKLRQDVRNELVASGRAAANAAITSTLEKFADNLHQRTAALTQTAEKAKPSEEGEPESRKPDEASEREPEKPAGEAEQKKPVEGEHEQGEREQPKAEVPEQRTEEEPFRGEKAAKAEQTTEKASSGQREEPSSQHAEDEGAESEQERQPEGEAKQAAKRE